MIGKMKRNQCTASVLFLLGINILILPSALFASTQPPKDGGNGNTPQSKTTSRVEDKSLISQLTNGVVPLPKNGKTAFEKARDAYNNARQPGISEEQKKLYLENLHDAFITLAQTLEQIKNARIPLNLWFLDQQFDFNNSGYLGLTSITFSNAPSGIDFSAGTIFGDSGGYAFSLQSDFSASHQKLIHAVFKYRKMAALLRQLVRLPNETDIVYILRLFNISKNASGEPHSVGMQNSSINGDKAERLAEYIIDELDNTQKAVTDMRNEYLDAQQGYRVTFGSSYAYIQGSSHILNNGFHFSKLIRLNHNSHSGISIQANAGVDTFPDSRNISAGSSYVSSGLAVIWQDVVPYFYEGDSNSTDARKKPQIKIWNTQAGAAYQFSNSVENSRLDLLLRLRYRPAFVDFSFRAGLGIHEAGSCGIEINQYLRF